MDLAEGLLTDSELNRVAEASRNVDSVERATSGVSANNSDGATLSVEKFLLFCGVGVTLTLYAKTVWNKVKRDQLGGGGAESLAWVPAPHQVLLKPNFHIDCDAVPTTKKLILVNPQSPQILKDAVQSLTHFGAVLQRKLQWESVRIPLISTGSVLDGGGTLDPAKLDRLCREECVEAFDRLKRMRKSEDENDSRTCSFGTVICREVFYVEGVEPRHFITAQELRTYYGGQRMNCLRVLAYTYDGKEVMVLSRNTQGTVMANDEGDVARSNKKTVSSVGHVFCGQHAKLPVALLQSFESKSKEDAALLLTGGTGLDSVEPHDTFMEERLQRTVLPMTHCHAWTNTPQVPSWKSLFVRFAGRLLFHSFEREFFRRKNFHYYHPTGSSSRSVAASTESNEGAAVFEMEVAPLLQLRLWDSNDAKNGRREFSWYVPLALSMAHVNGRTTPVPQGHVVLSLPTDLGDRILPVRSTFLGALELLLSSADNTLLSLGTEASSRCQHQLRLILSDEYHSEAFRGLRENFQVSKGLEEGSTVITLFDI